MLLTINALLIIRLTKMLNRHGTFDGWTKHTTENAQILAIIDDLCMTSGFIHHTAT